MTNMVMPCEPAEEPLSVVVWILAITQVGIEWKLSSFGRVTQKECKAQ